MVKTITHKEVKGILDKVNHKFSIVNMGTYVIINELERNEVTSYTYNSNFVYLNYCKMIRIEYLLIIRESMQ